MRLLSLGENMQRREFIKLIGGAAAAWPLAARAQQSMRVRRIAVLVGWPENDPSYRSQVAVFIQELARLGWSDARNIRIEERWTNADISRARIFAKELVAGQPDVIFAVTTPAAAALQKETSEIPIVFAVVSDPIGAGLVISLARPGGNLTGFINVEAAMGGKWLALLKEIAPQIDRAAIMFNPDTAPGRGNYFLSSFEIAAASLGIEPSIAQVRSPAEIERIISSLGHQNAFGRQNAGLVLMTDSFLTLYSETIMSLSARNNVPAISDHFSSVNKGGLISYGPNYPDLFRRAAGHVDRILHGEKASELPVETPIKFVLKINLKTAKALGLVVPNTLLAIADEVIE